MLPSIAHDNGHDNGLASVARALPVVGYHGPRRSIMVVDDDLHHLALVCNVFEPLGFAVITAPSAELALEMLAEFTPNLFILDIDMPGQDGWSLAQQLRDGTLVGVPIIMISGHAKDAETPKAQLALYDAFIAKPYNLDDLVMRTANLLKLELKLQDDITDEPIHAAALSSRKARELIKLALSGQANAIRRHLQELEDTKACPEPLLTTLKGQLASFDLKAMALELGMDTDG